MPSTKRLFAAFIVLLLLPFAAFAGTLAEEVNGDTRSFRGEWVHKIQTPGQNVYSVFKRIDVIVSNTRFRVVEDGGALELKFNGSILWELRPSKRSAAWFETAGIEGLPFWKIDPAAGALLEENRKGEETIAGRTCEVYRISGGRNHGEDVSVTYWIDKEAKVLLKKEYVLIISNRVYVRESYQSESVEFTTPAPADDFEAVVPEGWDKVEKKSLEAALLKTKF